MKVMCIKGAKQGQPSIGLFGPSTVKDGQQVYEGEYYTVADSMNWDGLVYRLAERPNNCWYDANRFIPMSDIDETELAEQRELQTV